jgi:hypothetical protein
MLRMKAGLMVGGVIALAVGIMGGRTLLAGWTTRAPAPTPSEVARVLVTTSAPVTEDMLAPATAATPKATMPAPAPKAVEAAPPAKSAAAPKAATPEPKATSSDKPRKARARPGRERGGQDVDWAAVSRELTKYGVEF